MTKSDRPEPSLVQNVVAINGFAYGAIGADIHVFANGLPLYLLANWRAEGEADQEWLRELPSRMLNARYAVVPFTGRDHELAAPAALGDSTSASGRCLRCFVTLRIVLTARSR